MALDDDIRILSDVRLFQGFTQEQLRLLAFGAETTLLQAERKLYREDDEADSAYIVVSGSIVLYREQDGAGVPVAMAGPGTILSELALIADTRRLTSASAATDSEVIRLSRKMFRRILDGAIWQPSARPRLIENRTAVSLTTGSDPGRPMSTGATSVFGAASWFDA